MTDIYFSIRNSVYLERRALHNIYLIQLVFFLILMHNHELITSMVILDKNFLFLFNFIKLHITHEEFCLDEQDFQGYLE